uniref:cDNA n=1 Tax=Steinernema glaseri TaxID=37863 RepID=A0A1I7YXQ8_9BILA
MGLKEVPLQKGLQKADLKSPPFASGPAPFQTPSASVLKGAAARLGKVGRGCVGACEVRRFVRFRCLCPSGDTASPTSLTEPKLKWLGKVTEYGRCPVTSPPRATWPDGRPGHRRLDHKHLEQSCDAAVAYSLILGAQISASPEAPCDRPSGGCDKTQSRAWWPRQEVQKKGMNFAKARKERSRRRSSEDRGQSLVVTIRGRCTPGRVNSRRSGADSNKVHFLKCRFRRL